MNQVVWVRLDEGVIINPAEEVSVAEVMGPNEEDARYHVNSEKRTCGCTYWQSIGIACKHAVVIWERYQSQLEANGEGIPQEPVNVRRGQHVRRAKWAVNEKPYFLAADFIAAANVLKGNRIIKGNRIKLPCDSIIQSDPTKYPPVPIADKKPRRHPVRRFVSRTRCSICQWPGHSRRTCDYYESWFEKDNDDHAVF